MASSFPNGTRYDLILGLKLSSVPKSVPDLINDLRRNESNAEVKLLVLDDYLLKCQEEMFLTSLFKVELSQYRQVVIDGMVLLQEEMKRITATGLDFAVRSPLDVSATKKHRTFKTKKDLDLNSPFIDHELQWSNNNERQEANSSTNQAASIFLDPARKAEKVPIDLNLGANKGQMMDFKLIPLTKPIWRNNRRQWTDELHARFLVVLHKLGGPEVATPKQIRDRMQVDGLTSDQVKSHLQKYRQNWRSYPEATAGDLQLLKYYCGEMAELSGAAGGINLGNRA